VTPLGKEIYPTKLTEAIKGTKPSQDEFRGKKIKEEKETKRASH